MEGKLPPAQIPFVVGDFNARGWGGNGDENIYVLDALTLKSIPARDGTLVFVWNDDEPGTILGVVATLEHASVGAFSGWRAKPVSGTFYRGPKPAHLSGSSGA